MKPVDCFTRFRPHRIRHRECREHSLAVDEKHRCLTANGCTIDEFLQLWIQLQFQGREHVGPACRQSPPLHSRMNTAALEILEVTRRRYPETALLRAFHDRSRNWMLRVHLDSRLETQRLLRRDSIHG